ncbi:MAG: DsbA family oxidoreductase [Balneolales bacterium]
MKVEIWSDIMCPFCYIGKRHFEDAMKKLLPKSDIEIIWKSFQLNPDMVTDPKKNINEYLAEVKGWSIAQARNMNQSVTDMAGKVGLSYNMDQAVVANSFDAHRLIQMAKDHGLGDQAGEALFHAYFTNGENIADKNTLIRLSQKIGLDKNETEDMLNGTSYSQQVNQDIQEAKTLGVTGVPFFVLNRKYAISGAQPSDVFIKAMEKAMNEEESTHY